MIFVPGRLFIVGAGGHAKVVMDAVTCAASGSGPLPSFLVVDDNSTVHGKKVLGVEVVAALPASLDEHDRFHVAIGNNAARERKYVELAGRLEAATVIHPRSSVCASAVLGAGSFVAAQAVVGPDAVLGEKCIVNHGAVVDHDCQVGAFCHIAPNATLAGNVRVGKRVLVGAGANILPGVSIGDDCVVGAGAVVTRNMNGGTALVGVPAREINRKNK